jgi:hypothetical protein
LWFSDGLAFASFRLQEAKQRTREEFTRNINQILEGTALDKKVQRCFLEFCRWKIFYIKNEE